MIPDVRNLVRLAIAALLFLGVSGHSQAAENPMAVDKAQIDAMLSQNLPVGTSRDAVISYLDNHHIENSGARTRNPNSLVAIFRNLGGNLLVKTSVQVTFNFEKDRLIGFSSRELYTGP
jgi:hypothetical protein